MLLELRGITKRFGPLVANDHIDLVIEPGQIHALLGENGAGKSTLMNVLFGLYEPDEGEIVVDGAPVTFRGPSDALAAGIGMVHQHFMLVPVFTVAESVMLGHESTRAAGCWTSTPPARQVRELSATLRVRRRPRRADRGPPGRRAAARRDHQGHGPRRRGPHPRRAHRRPDPAGDRRADRDHAPARGGRDVDRLHHPQAARGARRRGRHHRDPSRQGGRVRRADRRARPSSPR